MILGLSTKALRFWFYSAPADMHKGFDGLSGIVRDHCALDPLTGDVFVLVSHACTHIKLLCWDGDGFVLYCKRLENGRFDFPVGQGDTHGQRRELRRDELLMLLEGVRLSETSRKRRYELPVKR